MQNFTLEELILFLYKEMPENEAIIFAKEMEASWSLKEKYTVLKEVFERINKIPLVKPRQSSIDMILHHANSTDTLQFI